uniref:EF-hand domain-containing protein n=1 Tax=Timema bartmani TaxID=61472 RepID=A0A7R9FCD6_9NEOP|nr:unnamed protein product [Timema bartmani]
MVSILHVNVICVGFSFVSGAYINGEQSHTLHEFSITVPPCNKIAEAPNDIIYLPVLVTNEEKQSNLGTRVYQNELVMGLVLDKTRRRPLPRYTERKSIEALTPINKLIRQFQRKVADKPQRAYQIDSDSDSESDSEMHHEKGNSEFWRRKMRTFHGLIDINKDGVVSIDDFTILAKRFINLGHLTPQQQQEFTEMIKVVWEEQWGIVHPYNTVTAEQYLDNMHHVLNDKSLKRKAHNFLPHLFKAVDKDKNGTISVEEFKLFFECLGLNEEDAAASFSSIDINKDGYLSQKEFVKLGREFFISEDEATASRNFFGPLIKP